MNRDFLYSDDPSRTLKGVRESLDLGGGIANLCRDGLSIYKNATSRAPELEKSADCGVQVAPETHSGVPHQILST